MYRSFLNSKYGYVDTDDKLIMRERDYQHIIDESNILTYDIENMPKPIHDLLESILFWFGSAVIGRLETDKDKIVVGFYAKVGNPPLNDDGTLQVVEGVTITGNKIVDACLIRANSSMFPPRQFTKWYAMQLSKVDFSQWKLTEKSVCNPIPFARTQVTVDAINNALKTSGQTDVQAYLNDTDTFGETTTHNDFDLVDLTNVSYADKFKYLSAYHDDLTRRIYFIGGMACQSPTKQAQTNDSELQNRDDISMIYIKQSLEVRSADMERANEILGTDYHYKINELWLRSEPEREGLDNGEITED